MTEKRSQKYNIKHTYELSHAYTNSISYEDFIRTWLQVQYNAAAAATHAQWIDNKHISIRWTLLWLFHSSLFCFVALYQQYTKIPKTTTTITHECWCMIFDGSARGYKSIPCITVCTTAKTKNIFREYGKSAVCIELCRVPTTIRVEKKKTTTKFKHAHTHTQKREKRRRKRSRQK